MSQTPAHNSPQPPGLSMADVVGSVQWTNPTPRDHYDLVVIGAGTAGLVAAAGAAGLGAQVALIEKKLMGGDCLNYGCVPSKALLSAAKQIRHGANTSFDDAMAAMRTRRLSIAPHDSPKRFSGLGVDVFFAKATFTGRRTISFDDTDIRFSRAAIATGASALVPPIEGMREAGILTNESIFDVDTLPKRLSIIGGGPIGCELALAFASFGSQVTLLEAADRILSREITDASAVAKRSLEAAGVTVKVKTKVVSISADRTIVTESDEELPSDKILVAVGRSANIDELGLEQAGVTTERGLISTNERMQTANKRIFAIGDCASKWQFTHAADDMARMMLRNAWFFGRQKHRDLIVPRVTYLDPEIATVGQLPSEGHDVYRVNLEDVDRAVVDDRTDGFIEVYTTKGKDKITGATIVAPVAGELISELTLAMSQDIGLGALSSVSHPYPTMSLGIRQVADKYSKTRLKPWIARLLAWIIRRRR